MVTVSAAIVHLRRVFPRRSFASGFQAVSVLLLLPVIASLRGISPGQLPAYLMEGAPGPPSLLAAPTAPPSLPAGPTDPP